jgi:hypothetical protein
MMENVVGIEFAQTSHPVGWHVLRLFLDIGNSGIP